MSLKERIVDYIKFQVDKGVFESVVEAVTESYAAADSVARDKIKNTNPTRVRAQMRRYFTDDSMAGLFTNGMPTVHKTDPVGEHFVTLESGNVTISHIELKENEWARNAKHREGLASKNSILQPYNLDLFEEPPPKTDDSLHIAILVLRPSSKEENQAEPVDILITVPHTDWRGYHLEIPIGLMISSYGELKPEASLTDGAWPSLKKEILAVEDSTERKEE